MNINNDYEKDESMTDRTVTSNQSLCCAETGRVIAVFYNDYDLDAVLRKLNSED